MGAPLNAFLHNYASSTDKVLRLLPKQRCHAFFALTSIDDAPPLSLKKFSTVNYQHVAFDPD